MRIQDVDHFFRTLSHHWNRPLDILLLGGTAALLMGGNRPTMDIDFEFHITRKQMWGEFENAVKKTERPFPLRLALLWKRALQESPCSTALFLVKKNAHYFFKTFGKKIWGRAFKVEEILMFLRSSFVGTARFCEAKYLMCLAKQD